MVLMCSSVKDDGTLCGYQLEESKGTCPQCNCQITNALDATEVIFIICQGKTADGELCNQVIEAGIDVCPQCGEKVPAISLASCQGAANEQEYHITIETSDTDLTGDAGSAAEVDIVIEESADNKDATEDIEEVSGDHDDDDGDDYVPTEDITMTTDEGTRRSGRIKTKPHKLTESDDEWQPVEEASMSQSCKPKRTRKTRDYNQVASKKPRLNYLNRKKDTHHTDQLHEDVVIQFQCKFCSVTIQSDKIVEHIESEHKDQDPEGSYVLDVITFLNEMKSSQKNKRPGKRMRQGNFQCSICDKLFTYRVTLLTHVERIHSDHKDFGDVIKKIKEYLHINCGICGARIREDGIGQHMKSVHAVFGQFKCPDCDNVFRRDDLLKEHSKRVHDQVERFLCDNCPKTFKNRIYLQEHIYATHVRKQNFQCHVCQKILTSPRILAKHVKTLHGDCKLYKCPECERKFNTPANMRRHVKLIHHPQSIQRIPCQEKTCEKTFTSLSNMRQHQMTCHGSAFMYKCNHCQRRFNCSQREFGLHLETHKTDVTIRPKPNILFAAQPTQAPMFLSIERMPAGSQLISNSTPLHVSGTTQIFEQHGQPQFIQGVGEVSEHETVVIKATNAQGQPVKLSFLEEGGQLQQSGPGPTVSVSSTNQCETDTVGPPSPSEQTSEGQGQGEGEGEGEDQAGVQHQQTHYPHVIADNGITARVIDEGTSTVIQIEDQGGQVMHISQETLAAAISTAMHGSGTGTGSEPLNVLQAPTQSLQPQPGPQTQAQDNSSVSVIRQQLLSNKSLEYQQSIQTSQLSILKDTDTDTPAVSVEHELVGQAINQKDSTETESCQEGGLHVQPSST